MISFAMCGSFCTHKASLDVLHSLCSENDVLPLVSESVYCTDTRFGTAATLLLNLEETTGHTVMHTIKEAEALGPSIDSEALIICPCTGNTLGKLAHGITDTSVTMAAKAHFRCNKPVVIALASNDALGANLANLGTLLNRKNVYIVPMYQDDPIKKPHSLVADMSLTCATLGAARKGIQIRPIFLQ